MEESRGTSIFGEGRRGTIDQLGWVEVCGLHGESGGPPARTAAQYLRWESPNQASAIALCGLPRVDQDAPPAGVDSVSACVMVSSHGQE